ncbi:MAG: type III-B CRISPR module-associated protein Cmr3 [Caldisericia bacterium]|nr:type III-B CRISPR module-associated protein Cmr3 [Caldisericia bacterium]
MLIEITPMDTLFFRDGKPFNASEDGVTGSMFPPNPSVLYGFLRTLYFGENPKEICKAETENDVTKTLEIKAIYYKIGNEDGYSVYFNAPLDYVYPKKESGYIREEKKNKSYEMDFLEYKNREIISNKSSFKIIPSSKEQVENLTKIIISKNDLSNYLKNPNKKRNLGLLSDYIIQEEKTGIKKGSNRTAEEGHLYRINMLRLSEKIEKNKIENIKLVVEYDGIEINTKTGISKLGGEGKNIKYEIISKESNLFETKADLKNGYFKLILLTPSYLKNGFEPDLQIEDVELVSVCIGKAINIGGFDMAEKEPKPMFKAIPAGSTFVYKINNCTEEKIKEIKEKLDFKSISDDIKYITRNITRNEPKNKIWDLSKEGFGISIIGGVNID